MTYADFFGLKQEAFRLTPDPRFLHLAEPHRNALRSMLEGVYSRKGLQVCVGPTGTGKTTLLYCLHHILLLETSAERPIYTALIVNPTLTRDELFETLIDELELSCPGNTKPSRLRILQEFLVKTHSRKGLVLFVIDEAHLLSPELLEEIRLLLNSDNYPVNVLQVILCGQPELASQFMKPAFIALRGRVAVVNKLRALTCEESAAYIAQRLRIAGMQTESPFTAGALTEIQHRTNGIPRLINLLCDRALDCAFRRRVREVGSALIAEAFESVSSFNLLSVNDDNAVQPLKLEAVQSRI